MPLRRWDIDLTRSGPVARADPPELGTVGGAVGPPLDHESGVILERLMGAAEVAEILAVPRTWVYRAGREGLLPCVRMGRYMRFRQKDLAAWIEGGGKEWDE